MILRDEHDTNDFRLLFLLVVLLLLVLLDVDDNNKADETTTILVCCWFVDDRCCVPNYNYYSWIEIIFYCMLDGSFGENCGTITYYRLTNFMFSSINEYTIKTKCNYRFDDHIRRPMGCQDVRRSELFWMKIKC